MTEKKAAVIRLVYKIIFSLLALTVAVLLIYEVCDIYFGSGGGTFARDNAILRLKSISVPIWLLVAMAIIGLVLWEVLPPQGKKKYGQDVRYSLYRLRKKLPVKAEGDLLGDAAKVAFYDRILKIVWGVVAAVCVVFAAVGLAYLTDSSNFTVTTEKDSNTLMVECVIKIIPYVASAFALCIGAVFYEAWNAKKQLPHIKKLVALGRKDDPSYGRIRRAYYAAVSAAGTDITLWTVRGVLFVVAVVFIILGVFNGGASGVLAKATAICSECIGLA